MSGPSILLTAKGRPTVALVADITGQPLSAEVTDEEEIDVRAPEFVMQTLDESEAHFRQTLPFTEETLAPRLIRLSRTGRVTKFNLAHSNYARFLAAAEILRDIPLNEQREGMSRFATGTPPWLSHSLGVNCSLETSDHKLLWTRRPESTLEGNHMATVMGEGAQPKDVVDGTWSPETTARRGFHEELGFPLLSGSQLRISFHAVFAQFGNGGISIAGHAITTLTLAEILEQHHEAPDAKEHANGLFICDADPDAVAAFLQSWPFETWTSWGTGNLWTLMKYRLGGELDGLASAPLTANALADKG